MPSTLTFAAKYAVPLLFALGIRTVFSWGRIGWAAWGTSVVFLLGAILLVVLGRLPGDDLYPLMWPAIQFTWYHLLKRLAFGDWKANPPLLMFRYREDLGSQRDRNFGGIFFLSSLLLPLVILKLVAL